MQYVPASAGFLTVLQQLRTCIETPKTNEWNKEHNIELLKSDDVNHFDPNYFKGNFWGLPDLKASEEAYIVARDYFLNKKIQIIDYTINGKLQTFTKGVISNLYKK